MSDAVHKASDAVKSAAVDENHHTIVSSAVIEDVGTADADNSMDLSAFLLSNRATAPLYSSKRNKPIGRTSHRKAKDVPNLTDKEWELMVFRDVPDWIEPTVSKPSYLPMIHPTNDKIVGCRNFRKQLELVVSSSSEWLPEVKSKLQLYL
jgi:hypothetical protein